jgi:hypothetical protein
VSRVPVPRGLPPTDSGAGTALLVGVPITTARQPSNTGAVDNALIRGQGLSTWGHALHSPAFAPLRALIFDSESLGEAPERAAPILVEEFSDDAARQRLMLDPVGADSFGG